MKNIKATKSSIAAVAVAGSFTLLGASAVQADVLATSVLQINNLIFSQGGTALDVSDFTTGIIYTSTADISAKLGGGAPSEDGKTTLFADDIDLAPVCQGSVAGCAIVTDNGFPILSSGSGSPSEQFSAADQYQTGSPITGLLAEPVGADITSAAYVSLVGQDVGSSTGNNNLNSSWGINGVGGTIDVDLDATAYLEAFVSADSLLPSFATASFAFTLTLSDLTLGGVVVDSWVVGSTIDANNPFSLNDTRSANSPFANGIPLFAGSSLGVANSGHFSYTTIALDASHSYQLSSRTTAEADALMVPEPGMIALLGAGLLGLGFSRKRREA